MPYPLKTFKGLLNGKIQTAQGITQDGSHLAYRTPNLASLSLADFSDYPPRKSDAIADRCAQVRRLRETPCELSEPDWHADAGLLYFAEDGEEKFHEWSSKHPNYKYEDAQQKLERVGRLSGATTCARFETLNPEGCEGCKYKGKINSPISLGYEKENPNTPVVGSPLIQVNGFELPNLPRDYGWRNGALVFESSGQRGPKDILISSYPVYLQSVNKGEVRGNVSLTFRQKLPFENWSSTTVDAKELYGPNGVGTLREAGVNPHDSEQFRRYVTVAIDVYHASKKMMLCYDQYGWKQTGFLYGKFLYGDELSEAAINKELTIRNQWVGPGAGAKYDPTTGLERWKQAVNTLFAPGLEAQGIAILASFGSPLMWFLPGDEGGAILSLVSQATGEGKTLALAGAVSIWGDRLGLGLHNYDNRVTKYLTLAALGNLPLVYDEIAVKDPDAIREFCEIFTNGRDKMRADRSGQIRHSAARWQCNMLCACNASLVDTMSTGGDPQAIAARVFEMESHIPEQYRSVVNEKLKLELQANAGFAGEFYVQYLWQRRDEIRAWVAAAIEDAPKETGFTQQQTRFWNRLYAVMKVAGKIANDMGLINCSTSRLLAYFIEQGKRRIQEVKPSAVMLKTNWPVSELSRFVAQMKPHTLRIQGVWWKNKNVHVLESPRDVIYARYETGNKRFTVNYELMKSYAVERGFPFHEWRNILTDNGVMSQLKKMTLTAGTEIPGGQMMCYEINLNHVLMSGEQSEGEPVVHLVQPT